MIKILYKTVANTEASTYNVWALLKHGDDPPSLKLWRAGSARYSLPYHPVVITLGMTGFDSVITRCADLLFGVVPVPVTHMVHTLSGKSDIFARLSDTVENAKQLAAEMFPTYAFARA